MTPQPIAILCGDLHLSLTQPVCRADKDWLEVQAGYLRQLRERAGDLPIVCAGDIFDRWNPPPELIHFALEHLPDGMFCVPGQHDLPMHRLEDKHRSGYGVLTKVEKIVDLTDMEYVIPTGHKLVIWGFGWEEPITPPEREVGSNLLHLAVIHRYCWTEGKGFPGAPAAANLSAYKRTLAQYDVAAFGDNHKGFLASIGKCQVMNCGTFIRRKFDELSYVTRVGVLYSDGSIKQKKLDVSKDRYHEVSEEREEHPFNVREFIAGLETLGEHGLDFCKAVRDHLKNEPISKQTKELVLQALEPDNKAA